MESDLMSGNQDQIVTTLPSGVILLESVHRRDEVIVGKPPFSSPETLRVFQVYDGRNLIGSVQQYLRHAGDHFTTSWNVYGPNGLPFAAEGLNTRYDALVHLLGFDPYVKRDKVENESVTWGPVNIFEEAGRGLFDIRKNKAGEYVAYIRREATGEPIFWSEGYATSEEAADSVRWLICVAISNSFTTSTEIKATGGH